MLSILFFFHAFYRIFDWCMLFKRDKCKMKCEINRTFLNTFAAANIEALNVDNFKFPCAIKTIYWTPQTLTKYFLKKFLFEDVL